MEKKRQKIWTAIGVGIAIALLLYWLTLAIWIYSETSAPTRSQLNFSTKFRF